MPEVSIDIQGTSERFTLQFTEERGRWSAPRKLPESYFPLVAEIDGRRIELYSDGTFAEVER